MAFLDTLVSGAEVRIESTLLPMPIRFSLADVTADTPPSTAIKILRPKITVTKNGSLITQVAPGGDPAQGFPVWLVVGLLGVVAILFAAHKLR